MHQVLVLGIHYWVNETELSLIQMRISLVDFIDQRNISGRDEGDLRKIAG